MTSTDPLDHVVETATRAGADHDSAAVLTELRTVQDLLTRHDAAIAPDVRRELRDTAVQRMRAVAAQEKPLGVDLEVDAVVAVPEGVVDDAATAAAALVRLVPDPAGPAAWRDYHRRFLDRYGIGAIVALPELLHAGTGLGYPAGYRDTHLPTPATGHDAHTRRRLALLTRLAHAGAWDRGGEVTLIDADLDALTGDLAVRPQPHTRAARRGARPDPRRA